MLSTSTRKRTNKALDRSARSGVFDLCKAPSSHSVNSKRSSIRQSMKQMHSKEFDALLQLPAPDRYALFIRRVADWEEVWSLRSDDGWCLVSDDDGVEAFPVWPHQQFADACVNSMDKETSAKISLQDWLEKWLPGMMGDGRKVAVFPTPNGQGIVVSPSQLRDDLLAECEPYE